MARVPVFMFTMYATFSVMVFFLPLYLQHRGLDPAQTGAVIGWGSLVSMAAQPFWGVVSDRMKTVKKVLLAVLAGSLLASAGLFAAETLLVIGLLYVVFQFFYSATAPMSETLCVAYAQDRGQEFGKLRLWGEVGVGTAALGLGFLVAAVGIGYVGVIFAVMLCAAMLAALLLRDASSPPAPVNFRRLAGMFAQPKLLGFLLLILIVAVPHRMNDSMLALHLERIGGSEKQLGLAWSIAALSCVPVMLLAGRIIRRFGEMTVFVAASVLYVFRWTVVSQAATPEALIAIQIMQGMTFPLFFVSAVQYVQRLVPPELRATGMAAFAVTFVGFGGLLGSAAGGYAMNAFGPEMTYGAGAVMAAVSLALSVGAYRRFRRAETADPAAIGASAGRASTVE